MSSVWLSKLGMSLFWTFPLFLLEFRQDISLLSPFRSSHVAVSRPCRLLEFTPCRALLMHMSSACPRGCPWTYQGDCEVQVYNFPQGCPGHFVRQSPLLRLLSAEKYSCDILAVANSPPPPPPPPFPVHWFWNNPLNFPLAIPLYSLIYPLVRPGGNTLGQPMTCTQTLPKSHNFQITTKLL